MKVFVAAALGPDADSDDFAWTVEGELVTVAVLPCDDDECGCRRAMAGISSSRATSVFMVADLPMTVADYVSALRDSLIRQGWLTAGSNPAWFHEFVQMHIEDAAWLPVGLPLRVDDDSFTVRNWRDVA